MRAALAAWMVLSLLAGPGAGDTCGGVPTAPSRSVPAPQLSPEERLSPHMPQSLRCDACQAIAFQIEEHLRKAEGKVGKKALKESDYLEVLERSCSQDWESYGVLELDGEKRLSGPGLPGPQSLSVLVSGGPWPGRLLWPRVTAAAPRRLSKLCHGYVGEQGEAQ
ncbi:MZB1 protein, partial [Cisticola juncidis]|nr:MZB1 protein [Cisticola juncidis]